MALLTKAPKGTYDLLPRQTAKWQAVEAVMKDEATLHGFREIRTPVFEHTELFLRGVGDTTDVVEKQMYTFNDKGGRSITLRPEGTAGATRAMLEHALYNEGYPIKLFYNTSCYRYEKPQAGRLRELHQFGVEMFGAADAAADAQVILLGYGIFQRLGLSGVELEINSIGCPTCRAKYHAALKEYFTQYKDQLCETCQSRLERNPMRILDCKSPDDQKIAAGAPKILEFLCEECDEHFKNVQEYLNMAGVEYKVNPTIVRGLDYYTRTVFEFTSTTPGCEYAIGGGGRYDGLVEQLGGKPTPGLGFGLGMDRIQLVMEAQEIEFPEEETCEVYFASMGAAAGKKAFLLAQQMRSCGIAAESDVCARGLKAQMKYADKIGAQYTVVLGDNELETGEAELKNMKTGEKQKISLGDDFLESYVSTVTEQMDLSI
ncbi:MAG: histidine--tRNA ligase [Clostridia bacterium]|nr:histidine--tRNA ligase [Clostridia bacterium]